MKEDGIFIMSQLIGAQNVMVEHSSPPSFLKVGSREVNFDYLPWRGESEKLKKAGGSMVQGQVFLKWAGVGGERGAGTSPI